ncbi:MAG: family 20 glycosylhydrolase [Bryobacterales bacterium]|nr:family 20 glycosylhydrolase [Bryobacteraceae bacterium]MDW8129974.1 family 20 glycosylhydrolase [Bryobacterales bacterium]
MSEMSRRDLLRAIPAATAAARQAPAGEVRGLHLSAPRPDDLGLAVRFIREALPKEGVNLLVLEFGYRYRFSRRPEIREQDALGPQDVARLAEACREAGVRLIPQVNCLGHQSWARTTFALLRAYPHFDETPGAYPGNEGIYCRSYCPLHPELHAVLFDLMDELAEACAADAFHVGMDEVFLIGEPQCPRCRGRNKAELFAGEVRRLRDHLAGRGLQMWMWGDRFLDGERTGLGKWEASMNQTHPAVGMVPRDIVICDWHYENAPPTAAWFATEGFPVVCSPWRKPEVALAQWELVRHVRRNAPDAIGRRMLGMLQTSWVGFGPFVRTYFGEPPASPRAQEAVNCFRTLFEALRRAG